MQNSITLRLFVVLRIAQAEDRTAMVGSDFRPLWLDVQSQDGQVVSDARCPFENVNGGE